VRRSDSAQFLRLGLLVDSFELLVDYFAGEAIDRDMRSTKASIRIC